MSTVTGYQFSPQTSLFIGEYTFDKNEDKEEIHMPPYTTLVAPPPLSPGFVARWTGDAWEIMVDPAEPPYLVYQLMSDDEVGALLPAFVAAMPPALKPPGFDARYAAARAIHEQNAAAEEQAKWDAAAAIAAAQQQQVEAKQAADFAIHPPKYPDDPFRKS